MPVVAGTDMNNEGRGTISGNTLQELVGEERLVVIRLVAVIQERRREACGGI
jgi:hypothetical protein